jgi:hypothetical protein
MVRPPTVPALASLFQGTAIVSLEIGRMIDDAQSHSAGGFKAELVLAVALGLIVIAMTVYFAL